MPGCKRGRVGRCRSAMGALRRCCCAAGHYRSVAGTTPPLLPRCTVMALPWVRLSAAVGGCCRGQADASSFRRSVGPIPPSTSGACHSRDGRRDVAVAVAGCLSWGKTDTPPAGAGTAGAWLVQPPRAVVPEGWRRRCTAAAAGRRPKAAGSRPSSGEGANTPAAVTSTPGRRRRCHRRGELQRRCGHSRGIHIQPRRTHAGVLRRRLTAAHKNHRANMARKVKVLALAATVEDANGVVLATPAPVPPPPSPPCPPRRRIADTVMCDMRSSNWSSPPLCSHHRHHLLPRRS
uniref:Uncharacterized protein n=1 Tax=Leersia perrieri TaxID=77586 RepID=A0A0D9WXT1_9ORYZ